MRIFVIVHSNFGADGSVSVYSLTLYHVILCSWSAILYFMLLTSNEWTIFFVYHCCWLLHYVYPVYLIVTIYLILQFITLYRGFLDNSPKWRSTEEHDGYMWLGRRWDRLKNHYEIRYMDVVFLSIVWQKCFWCYHL